MTHRGSHAQPRVHVVFSAECSALFDWHSVGIFYSFDASNFSHTANITRLLACSEAEQKLYPASSMQIGPTFVHRNLRDDPLVDEKGYPSYNKPYSVMAWLGKRELSTRGTGLASAYHYDGQGDEFVLMTDADMIFRRPIDPIALGAARGVVVSAEYTYLVGTESGFAERFITKHLIHRLAQVGGFHIFHAEDLRQIAPLWLEYTKKVRAFAHSEPDVFFRESMMPLKPDEEPMRAVRQKQSKWHSEMYGYVFAAAEVGVTHRVRRDVMLYPGYQPWFGRSPSILHYGSDYTVSEVYFNKMSHTDLKIETCPTFLFGAFTEFDAHNISKRDALCIEHLAIMDAALCRHYISIGCGSEHIPTVCKDGGEARLLAAARETHKAFLRCEDDHEGCVGWAQAGECLHNPQFMHSNCAKACGSCDRPIDQLLPEADLHLGDWKWVDAHSPPPQPFYLLLSPPQISPPPPPPPLYLRSEELPLNQDTEYAFASGATCVDHAASLFCSNFVKRGGCKDDLQLVLTKCAKSCGLCTAQGAASTTHSRSADDDLSGYGHPVSQQDVQRERTLHREDHLLMLLLIGGSAAVLMILFVQKARQRCSRPPKIADKCAV
mmetsp:Transcript_2166/g.3590  ORF Transcript_2166/g.3590 Transcript_2166/m.3590 type:complete len:606 (+) Transcript_2166:33-1850(+)